MQFDSDVVLLGTGVAPLVAASQLIGQGKSILILNPDWDFFLEDSELPLDPILPFQSKKKSKLLNAKRLENNSPQKALAELRPHFPGAVEFWSGLNEPREGFHDPLAPHVRQRAMCWLSSFEKQKAWNWEDLEDLFVEFSDAGLKPQILEGVLAATKLPGFSSKFGSDLKGVWVPKFCDVDVSRYRNGLLEFIRERLGSDRVVSPAAQIELMPGGTRFHTDGTPRTAKVKDGILVFWTPRLTQWVLSQIKKLEVPAFAPTGVRLWEQWSLISRDPLDPQTVAVFDDMAIWAETEGAPDLSLLNRLSVLRPGPLAKIDQAATQAAPNWATSESFNDLSDLCYGFLNWDRFTVGGLKTRSIFEWSTWETRVLSQSEPRVHVVPGSDGALVDVISAATKACEALSQ